MEKRVLLIEDEPNIIQAISFWNYCELVPSESVFGEDVTGEELVDHQRNRSIFSCKLPFTVRTDVALI